MVMTSLSAMCACFIVHLGKGYEGSKVRASVKLRDFATFLSRIFRMTPDQPMNRTADLQDPELRHHEWRFVAAMLDRFMFCIWALICSIFVFVFAIWVNA